MKYFFQLLYRKLPRCARLPACAKCHTRSEKLSGHAGNPPFCTHGHSNQRMIRMVFMKAVGLLQQMQYIPHILRHNCQFHDICATLTDLFQQHADHLRVRRLFKIMMGSNHIYSHLLQHRYFFLRIFCFKIFHINKIHDI